MIRGQVRFIRFVSAVLVGTIFLLGSIPSKSMAYVVGGEEAVEASRAGDMERLQRVLESKAISGKLEAMGLTPGEIEARLEGLSDSELHTFATDLDNLYPGTGAVGFVAVILILFIALILTLKATGRKIIIQ